LADRYAERQILTERAAEAQSQLELYAQNLGTLIERFRSVPALLALDSDIQDLLHRPDDQALRQTLNVRLERLNQASGSAVLYLLDTRGHTLAASNWNEPSSFVGHDYAFRPYFQDAVRTGSGRYFAVGVTTGVPGYFLSHAVRDALGELLGVLVVKLELEELQRDWLAQSGVLLVTDDHGIVILSNRPTWRFRYLNPLSDEDRQHLVQVRQYDGRILRPLARSDLRKLSPAAELSRIKHDDVTRDVVWQRRQLLEDGWTFHLLLDPSPADRDVRSYRLAAFGLWMTLVFLLLYLRQRRKNLRLQRNSRAELERLVQARTQALTLAQDELIQAAKMAALGQMSAALTHEINQPLTAMHMQLSTQRLLLSAGRIEDAEQNLERIETLLQRMAALTSHLKGFSRKTASGVREAIDLAHVAEQAVALMSPRINEQRVNIDCAFEGPAWVLGDGIRLEQVVLNLLQNALDALRQAIHPRIELRIADDATHWCLTVADNAGGIDEINLEVVFDPFFTTKPAGEGLGLGLAVSYDIIHDLGGSLTVANSAEGAVFTLRLAKNNNKKGSSRDGGSIRR
jgi:two-component system C4-dicarboxylate transport sensor histidine kinase DctB